MDDTEKASFAKQIAYVFALYPQAKLTEATSDAYWHHLKPLPFDAVRAAIHRSIAISDKFPPTAPAIRELAEIEDRSSSARSKYPAPGPVAGYLPRAHWEQVPRTDEGQRQYVLAAKTDAEKLARLWECEAVRAGIKPNEPPPQEIGAKWFRQLNKLLERNEPGSKAAPQAEKGAA